MTFDAELRRSTPLAVKLAARIRRDGPLDIASYMDACLNDPEHGYYRTRDAIGSSGDFITAPEISQVFGEIVGLWVAVVWQALGAPRQLTLVELGPGRGTLMRDGLRATRGVPGFHDALSVVLVEANPRLEAMQRSVLAAASVPVTWSKALPQHAGPAIVIANEFFDCVPIRQFIADSGKWTRRMVGLDMAGCLQFVRGQPAGGAGPSLPAEPEGTIAELADYAQIAVGLAELRPEAILAIDYGDTPAGAARIGDTLQAVRAHAAEHPLTSPGEADLTAHVDFRRLAADLGGATGLTADGPVTQATFLGRLGAVERASRLMAANPSRAAAIELGVARLLAPAGMGGRFKVLGLRSARLGPLPGLEGGSRA